MSNKYATEESLLNIRYVFWQQKKLILIVTIITMLISGFFIFNYIPTYEATVTIGAPLEDQASLIRTGTASYLRPFQEQIFSTGESYNTFVRFLLDLSYTQFFLMSHSAHSKINVYLRYDYKKTRYIISVKEKTPEQAEQYLNEYISFLIAVSEQYWTVILENRNQIIINQLHSALAQLKHGTSAEHEFQYSSLDKLNTLNNQTVQKINFFAPQLTQQLMRRLQEKNSLYAEYLLFIPEMKQNLFHFESPILLSNTVIESKLQCTLIIGGLGGMILGFLLASLYCGNIKRHVSN